MPRTPGDLNPTPHQRRVWEHWVMWQYGAGDGWWLGWCPLHDDPIKDPTKCTGHYNFAKGIFRCTKEKGNCTEPRKYMSLTNLAARVAARPDAPKDDPMVPLQRAGGKRKKVKRG